MGSSRWQKLAGESQYAVYVLQTITLPVVMFTLVLILRTAGYTVEFEFLQRASPVGHCRRLDLHSRVGHRDLVAAGIPISEVAGREGCVVGLGRLVCTRIQRHCSVFFRPPNHKCALQNITLLSGAGASRERHPRCNHARVHLPYRFRSCRAGDYARCRKLDSPKYISSRMFPNMGRAATFPAVFERQLDTHVDTYAACQ